MDAHAHSTGEDLYKTTPGFRNAHKYVAHATLPGGEFNFDFGDIYAGPITRSRTGDDYNRERINGKFRTNYNILYNLASRYRNGEAQGVADWLKAKGQVNAEEFWTFIWYDPAIRSVSIEKQEKWHYFADHDVAYWRSSWNDDATAFAFKAGPPEKHAATKKVKLFPEWRLSSGHAHPDAGSFIIWSDGKYLTGDSGYAGIPLTEHHNTLTFNGVGQAREGKGHDVFAGVPYERLDKIRLMNVKLGAQNVSIDADLTSAYEPELGVKKFVRSFSFSAPGSFVITDLVETDKPQNITAFLHADKTIKKESDRSFTFEPLGTQLRVDIASPENVEAKTEMNILTAPGRPGSVDKGEREERGVRLAVSTRGKVNRLKLIVKMQIERRR